MCFVFLLVCSVSDLLSESILLVATVRNADFTSSVDTWSSSSDSLLLSGATDGEPRYSDLFLTLSAPVFSAMSSMSQDPTMSLEFEAASPAIAMSSAVSLMIPKVSIAVLFSCPRDGFVDILFPAFNLPTVAMSVPFFAT